jgi:predicted transcriptional regulator
MRRTVLYSVKPEFANLILSGHKTVELRKRVPVLEPGDCVLLYISSPLKVLAGLIEVTEIITEDLHNLWCLVEDRACIDLDRFNDYFQGKQTGVGICLGRVLPFQKPIDLETLRAQWPGFVAPQDYRYVTLELENPRVFRRSSETSQPVVLTQSSQNDYLIRI